jgi:hypothetical protein
MNLGLNDWVAVGSAGLALVSLVLNWLVVSRQTELQFETLRAEMDAEVITWAHEAIDRVSEAVALARGRGESFSPEEFRRVCADVEFRLSSAADQGRLFFPNELPWAVGQQNESAFQGLRPPVLDALVFACCQVERLKSGADGPDQEAGDFLVKCRRLLVSEAQNAIDPRRRGAMIRRLETGRKDDPKSNFDVAYELGLSLNRRHPELPAIQAFLLAYEKFRKPIP